MQLPRTRRSLRYKPEWVSRLENRKFREPPSGLKPQATAMASSSVDFPLPFSPTKKVTGQRNSSRFSAATAGMRRV